MIRFITSLILAPRKENLLIICLVLGFLIMVTGSWLNGHQSDMVQENQPDTWQPATPSDPDTDIESSMRMYATTP